MPTPRLFRLHAAAAAILLALAAPGAPVFAQDDRAAGREIVKKWQHAIVTVRVVLKMRVSVGGRLRSWQALASPRGFMPA